MTLPSSGQITLNQVNVELDNSGTAQIGMGDTAVRDLFGIASGEIEMSDGYGKSSQILPTQTYVAATDGNVSMTSSSGNGQLTFSGWSPQSGDLLVVVGTNHAYGGLQVSQGITSIMNQKGSTWYPPYNFIGSLAVGYRICDGTESNTINAIRGGSSPYSTFGAGSVNGAINGAVFRYSNAITGVSDRNTQSQFVIEPNGTTSSVTRVLNNSSISQPYIDFCDSMANSGASYNNAPTNYYSDMTNAFLSNRGNSSQANRYGRSVFRPSNGNESVTWTSLPHGGTGGYGNEVKVSRFSTTLLLSF
tara:strand:- start:236 stop:1147 length:912 start_codon:yes stop_codon:yes gene_type:complete